MSYAITRRTSHEVLRWTIAGLGDDLTDCKNSRVTKVGPIDDSIEKCCQDVKSSKGKSVAEMARQSEECIARGVSAAAGVIACTAAGAAIGGVGAAAGAALAPLCGTVAAAIGGAVYNRVAGYSTGQKVAGVVGAVVCGAISGGALAAVCGFAAAELVGWISDALGPVMEGIFHPGAAKKRELAARAAFHALSDAAREYRVQADDAMGAIWSQSISSIKQMYEQSIGLLTPASQQEATRILGFVPTYDSIAKAFVAAGAASTPLNWAVDNQGHTIADRIRANKANGGCERSAAGCANDGYSEVCPFSFNDYYMAFWNLINWKGTSREQQMTFDRKMLTQMQAIASNIITTTQQAISTVVTQLMIVATMLKQKELLAAAKAANEASLVASASKAAAKTQAAAAQATSWNSELRNAALTRAEQQYAIATHARFLLTFGADPSAPPASASSKQKMDAYVAKARSALALAQSNAQHAQIMMGVSAAAGVAGVATVGYLLLRRA